MEETSLINKKQQDQPEPMSEEQFAGPVVSGSFTPAAVVSPSQPTSLSPVPPSSPSMPAPPPPPITQSAPLPFQASAVPAAPPQTANGVVPMPVVRVLSPRGVEYVFMTVALISGALGLGSALISLVNGKTEFSVLDFPAATLLVSVPVFAWLFLRLKGAELADPGLRLDASKRRSTQFIQITSFFVSFFTVIGFISAVFAKMAGEYKGSIIKLLLDVLVVVVIAGGMLFYYWRDEHR